MTLERSLPAAPAVAAAGGPREVSVSKLLSEAAAAIRQGEKLVALRTLAQIEDRRARAGSAHGAAELRLLTMLRELSVLLPSPAPTNVEGRLGRVGDGEPQPLPGVSLVTCCMNRGDNLLTALPTWLAHDAVREVLIVDWNSREPVSETLARAGLVDRRIRVVRVLGESRWILSYAFNLGFRLARHAAILKVDADITLKPDFFTRNPLREGNFVAGDWTVARPGQEHINGFFYVRQADLLRIKGFNEYITTYGWDDDDLYGRLQGSALQRVCVDTESIYHIPHDDTDRLGAQAAAPANGLMQLQGDTRFQILTNRVLAHRMLPWNAHCQFAPFVIQDAQPGRLTVRRLADELAHVVSDAMRHEAQGYAAAELLASHAGPQVYCMDKPHVLALLELKRLEEVSPFDVALGIDGRVPLTALRRHSVVVELADGLPDRTSRSFLAALAEALDPRQVALFVSAATPDAQEAVVQATAGRALALDRSVSTADLPTLPADRAEMSAIVARAMQGQGLLLRLDDLPPSGARRSRTGRPSRLYVDAQHGLGNRLRAYASGAAIARRTGRELVLVWTPDHHCECRFGDLFEPTVQLIESPDEIPSDGVRRYSYMELEPGARKDEPIDLETNQDVLVRTAYTLNHPASQWQAENAELRALRPVAAVTELTGSVSVRGCIGAHVRMEAGKGLDQHSYDTSDNWSQDSHAQIQHWRAKSHYSAFVRRIDALLQERPQRRLFLATDLPENYEIFRARYGPRLSYLPRQVFDRSREQIVYALADALLLSRCEMLLGSTWSSFSELAMRLSTTYSKIEMSGKDF